MTADPALNAAIREAQHLLFSFTGAVLSADTGKSADMTMTTAPYIHEVLAACRESGRTASVIITNPTVDVPAYLETHDLFTQITVIAASVADANNFLEAAPETCLLITGSTVDIKTAQAAGASCIGYARTPDAAARLVDAGVITVVYSMADLALALRARRLDL